jgi:hypothetical protein
MRGRQETFAEHRDAEQQLSVGPTYCVSPTVDSGMT